MDGEEDDFMSGSRSDDGGGTPVQDEHPASDGEDMRSDRQQSEDEGSNDEDAPHAMETSGAASGSDNEGHQGVNSDSEGEAPRHHNDGDKSDSEAEAPRPADSDDDSPVKRRMSGSDNEEESLVKHGASENEEGEGSSPVRRRGSSSDMEEGEERHKAAADSDSENEDAKPVASNRSNADSDSDTETPARRKVAQIDSEEEGKQQEEVERGGGGKWKAVMQSDSEEEEGGRRKAPAGSDGEQQDEEREQRDDSDDEKPVKRKKAIVSDSEDEDEEKEDKPAVKRSRAVSDDENSDSDGGLIGPDKSLAAKLRELGSDSGSDDEASKATAGKKDEKALFGSDSDSGDDDEEEKMIADIFGESGDEEEEEFTGFNQEDLEGAKKEAREKQHQLEEESDSDEGVDRSGQDTSFMSDFDIMLARRKAMNSRKRRHRDGGTFISDADDVVSAMITKMNEAAEEDRTLNSQKKPALKKLTLLPQVVMHLKKQDLKETFIDSGVMSAIKEWISPLPDKSLPALRIREELLRILQELPSVSQETLKHSGIGRAVMFLYKHPKESRSNKDLALKLINEWSRPIFGLTSNYKGMTREERQQRDLDQQMPQRRRLSSGGQTPRRDLEKQLTGEEKALRPGDPGFCARARVPMPSNKDYVVRPKWNVEVDSSRGPMKKGLSRVDKQMRRFADIRRLTKTGHAVKISVEGNRMPL
ncbi:protein IWS1 homolog [Seriola lalandi dorsalis]|uniref:protein IWS1 homolog n=1 Tax=Seriola lalandi dorsalis TaxID=1841481 RepID=UPI000C6F68C1|nr:protein IWS1 homolog [Seriola lalandi dorsalis]XP_056231044.1 protein IWS1 homolog isoform X4 [Seriola aureovittata]